MEHRANFLSLILIDALEDGNEQNVFKIMENNDIDASFIPFSGGIAPIHYVCGISNEDLAIKVLKRFLEAGADPNVATIEGMQPLHIAAIYGRVEIVKLLLEYGADCYAKDDERKIPANYAIEECHFEVVQVMREHICKQKLLEKQKERNEHNVAMEEDREPVRSSEYHLTSTPKERLVYNYDRTSPYYINITHRRHHPQPTYPKNLTFENTEPVDIFSLTKENLTELNNHTNNAAERSRYSMIEIWREKVQRSKARQSILMEFDSVEQMVDNECSIDDDAGTSTSTSKVKNQEGIKETKKSNLSLGKLIQKLSQVPLANAEQIRRTPTPTTPVPIETSYYTVPDNNDEQEGNKNNRNSTNFIRSPNSGEYIMQINEGYVHTDEENGLVFYENKLLSNEGNKIALQRLEQNGNAVDTTMSSDSTNITIPIDYDTDTLRAELTQYEVPGPITKSTKRLYIKRLIKYKRNTGYLLEMQRKQEARDNRFSVELQRTIRTIENFQNIYDYMCYERESTTHFANTTDKREDMREGHLKQSFIYMLIDPRISCNLPGESVYLTKFDTWKRFLKAVFYVGKGKTTRPYFHLYEAMKTHSRLNKEQIKKKSNADNKGKNIIVRKHEIRPDIFKSPPEKSSNNKKLDRILDIWGSGNGVVCLHVFHNILPIDAYTREAAIIDALSLQHLTNQKRGDYYGPAKIWPMKTKKYFGIALLYKAMQIFLAEGESQLSPSDLL